RRFADGVDRADRESQVGTRSLRTGTQSHRNPDGAGGVCCPLHRKEIQMKLKFALIVAALALTGCGTTGSTAPSTQVVNAIALGCDQDGILRPAIQALVAVKGTPAEQLSLKPMEDAVDVVCANPAATPDANAQAAFRQALKDMATLEAALVARQV